MGLQLQYSLTALFMQCMVVVVSTSDEGALVTEKVYLDLQVEGQFAGRVVIGLFGTTSPKTVRNFVGLADHEVITDHF